MLDNLKMIMKRSPSLRRLSHVISYDASLAYISEDRYNSLKKECAAGIARFLLDAGTLTFRMREYAQENVMFGQLWVVEDNDPVLDGRKADMSAAFKQGAAHASRKILEAATARMIDHTGPWQSIAYQFIRDMERLQS